MLSEETRKAILELQKTYPVKRSALLPALHLVQEELGYLFRSVQEEIAELFDIDVNEVHSVVSFYDMYFEKPVGRHLLHVCQNISCMLRGSDELMEKLCQKLQIKPGENSSDGEFTLLSSECLAACDRAPMILIDDQVVGPVKEEELDELLACVKKTNNLPQKRS